MKKLIITTFSILLLSISAFTQEAIQVDDFDRIPCDDFLSRMDSLYFLAQRYPNKKIYVVYYGGRYRKEFIRHPQSFSLEKIKLRYAHRDDGLNWAKAIPLYLSTDPKYPEDFRNSIKNNLFLISGGYRENIHITIWLGLEESELPKPNPTIDEKDVRFKANKPIKTFFATNCY